MAASLGQLPPRFSSRGHARPLFILTVLLQISPNSSISLERENEMQALLQFGFFLSIPQQF